uniref:KRAB domain-containing protein n=1 Tax=Peromyscus maniculatus bairdii TaxID=230844 RepID=A0A8C8UJJ9_PERMB
FDARRYLMGRKRPYQSLVPFEDVIMCFSGEEWKHLTMTQTLYAEVTMENIALTSSMCYQCAVEDEEIPCEQVSEKPRMLRPKRKQTGETEKSNSTDILWSP